ncbi:hypothetical protein, partial [Burkholderia sp. GbtcB21]|uniref:hypothetical protein n=1 Tax=Burkholderia sp. GbtcB21 TaxID=2824766 RepID=UPI001C2FB9DC
MADSITTLRRRISAYIARRLQQCPFCSVSNADLLTQYEPPRVLWRLQLLREWSHEQEAKQVF